MSDFRSPIDTSVPSLSLQMPQMTTQQHRRDYSGSITLDDHTLGRPASGDATTVQEGAETDPKLSEGMATLHLGTAADQPSPPPPTDPAVLKLVGEVLASEVRILPVKCARVISMLTLLNSKVFPRCCSA